MPGSTIVHESIRRKGPVGSAAEKGRRGIIPSWDVLCSRRADSSPSLCTDRSIQIAIILFPSPFLSGLSLSFSSLQRLWYRLHAYASSVVSMLKKSTNVNHCCHSIPNPVTIVHSELFNSIRFNNQRPSFYPFNYKLPLDNSLGLATPSTKELVSLTSIWSPHWHSTVNGGRLICHFGHLRPYNIKVTPVVFSGTKKPKTPLLEIPKKNYRNTLNSLIWFISI